MPFFNFYTHRCTFWCHKTPKALLFQYYLSSGFSDSAKIAFCTKVAIFAPHAKALARSRHTRVPYARFRLIAFSLQTYLSASGFIVGNKSTSRIAAESVRSMHIRSMPKPMPPVGGIPISRACMKSSSVVLASSSPRARRAS